MGGRDMSDSQAEAIANLVPDLEQAVFELWPRLADEVALRERPIREQWEARGPGMLRRMLQLSGGEFSLPAAEIALVQPCLGGGGETHPQFQLVRLEAVLTNSTPTLPEPVRLGWLLFRLAAELVDLAAGSATPARRLLISHAAVPLALEAAEYVEWSTYDVSTLEAALDAWRLPGAARPEFAGMLFDWRDDSRHEPRSWRDALQDLGQRLTCPH
jgi:hypothetical protein